MALDDVFVWRRLFKKRKRETPFIALWSISFTPNLEIVAVVVVVVLHNDRSLLLVLFGSRASFALKNENGRDYIGRESWP